MASRHVLWLVAFAAVALASGREAAARAAESARPSPSFDDVVARAVTARQAERLAEAQSLYREAVLLKPGWAEGFWWIGFIDYLNDHYLEALEPLATAARLEPRVGAHWALLGLCEYRMKEYEQALEHIARALDLGLGTNDELNRVTRYHAAILFNRFGEFARALEVLRQMASRQEESLKLVEAFGICLLQMPMLPMEVPPDTRELVLLLGRAGYEESTRRLDEAAKTFAEARARYKDTPNVHYAHGVFLLSQDADAAIAAFRREIEVSPRHALARFQLAYEYMRRGDPDSALPLAEEAARLTPTRFESQLTLGRARLEKGQVAPAIESLVAAAHLAPQSPDVRFALARAYRRAGRTEDAAREQALFLELQEAQQAAVRRDGQRGSPREP